MKFLRCKPDNECRICKKEFKTLGGLHNHIRKSEGLTQGEYYAKFFPREDLFSGEPIKFKDLNDYKDRFFNSIRTEREWFRDAPERDRNAYILGLIQHRQQDHSDKFFYSTVEWDSLGHVPMGQLVEIAGEGWIGHLAEASKSLELSPRFDYRTPSISFNHDAQILIDTREQRPLFDGGKTTINVGDYTFEPKYYNQTHIDRKSQDDFIGTFTKGIDRFRAECEKAKALGIYLVVLVESPYKKCLDFMPQRRHKGQRVRGCNAFFNVRRLSQEFSNLQFLFVADREEAKSYARMILSSDIKDIDLQLNYNRKLI